MKRQLVVLASFILTHITLFSQSNSEKIRMQKQANAVTIARDRYGVPHIFGKTDADCVFGLMYSQCEDDFYRVEMNYIIMLGRTAELKGENEIYDDLLVRMTIDSAGAIQDYQKAPEWMKKLLQAWSDGIHYYLQKHPEVKPRLLTHFKPWYPLMYTDGSISAIQTGGLESKDIKAFYERKEIVSALNIHKNADQLTGSNGFAIAPSLSKTGNALFYINPHVTFYFRPEVHMISEEGLNVYGAVTWGQFFVYQGFNEHLGFMHTSSQADAADLYAEIIFNKNGKYLYEYEGKLLPFKKRTETIRYLNGQKTEERKFDVFSSKHGPVMGIKDGKWLSLKTNNRSLAGLIQSWERNKATDLNAFKKMLDYRANLSNNTVYADDKGNIAYWHGNYMPKRTKNLDWELPVDGSTKTTEWEGMHQINEIVHVINPTSGWIQNTNNTPFSVSGESSPNPEDYPTYMAPDPENFRGLNAVRLFKNVKKITLEELIEIGYNRHLTAFDTSLPILVRAFNRLRTTNSTLYQKTAAAIKEIENWNHDADTASIGQTLAIEWAEKINTKLRLEDPEFMMDFTHRYGKLLNNIPEEQLLLTMTEVMDDLEKKFGTWRINWGTINRMQRITGNIQSVYDDSKPSYPSPFASSTWGALPSFNSRTFNTSKRYGYGGNSFICAVEFGKKIKAKSLLAGGQQSNPASPHFFDQAEMYTKGIFKDVLFYKEDIMKNVERIYNPGKN